MNCENCKSTNLAEYWVKGVQLLTCRQCGKVHQMNETEEHLAWLQNMQKQVEKNKQEKEQSKQKPIVTCPYCQSTDTKKISKTSRFMSTGIFGLASKKLGKQWHCNKCKSDF